MAKRFFYVCAGLLCLALSWHLGARNAVGQSTHVIEGVNWTNGGLSAVVDGVLIQFDPNTGDRFLNYPLPVAGRVAETTAGGGLVYENGEVYVHQGFPGAWVRAGNLAGGPTPAQQESWGALKSRYRGERGAAQPAPQGR